MCKFFLREAQFKIIQIVTVTLCPLPGKEKSLSESNHVTQRYGNYRGGCPVPRATSLYNGGKQIYAITLVYVGFFSPHFAY